MNTKLEIIKEEQMASLILVYNTQAAKREYLQQWSNDAAQFCAFRLLRTEEQLRLRSHRLTLNVLLHKPVQSRAQRFLTLICPELGEARFDSMTCLVATLQA